jgi:hypothetical protein
MPDATQTASYSSKPAGKAITKDIPKDVRDFGIDKLSHDVNGNIRTGADGQPLKVTVIPARENGSYKGRVIANNDKYLIQAIGKEEKFAVVHEKINLTMVSNSLKWKDENKRLGQSNIQVHYDGTKANVYPYNPDRFKAQEKTAAKEAPAKDDLVQKVMDYAATIKNAKSRDAFIKHFQSATQAKAEPAKAEPTKAEPMKEKAEKTAKPKARELEFGDGGR